MALKWLKRSTPGFIKSWLRGLLNRCEQLILRLFGSNRYLASLYYCFFSRQFDREHLAVLKGRLAYRRQQGQQLRSFTLLRRNIHRIEKGLIMRPRKALFAADYIGETVAALIKAAANPGHDAAELKWAHDVLQGYFAVVDLSALDSRIKAGFEQAALSIPAATEVDAKHRPYRFDAKVNAQVSAAEFKALCVQRRSVRWFESRRVERQLLEQAVAVASLAPSACNRQPYRFYIADEPVEAQRLMAIPLGTKGFAHHVPCTVVVVAELGHYPSERDRHLIYIDGALAAMQLMLALETLGLSSCPINWPDIDRLERQMEQQLKLPLSQRPVMLIAVGYGCPEGEIPYSQKKSPAQLIEWIE